MVKNAQVTISETTKVSTAFCYQVLVKDLLLEMMGLENVIGDETVFKP